MMLSEPSVPGAADADWTVVLLLLLLLLQLSLTAVTGRGSLQCLV